MMTSSSRLALSKSYRVLHSKLHCTGSIAIIGVPYYCSSTIGTSTGRRCLSTYYDSQSGLHLPVHDENEIRLFLNVTNGHHQEEDCDGDGESVAAAAPFVPHNLNKDRIDVDEVSDKLQRFLQQGIHGLILPPIKFPRDLRNLQTLSMIAPPNFVFLCNSSSNSSNVDDAILKARGDSSSSTSTNIFSKVLRYENNNDFQDSLQTSVEKGLHTTLSITKDVYNDVEPITLANNIASMIDAKGGCDFLWISSSSSSKHKTNEDVAVADTIVQVCEELGYLDVAGATIKSRLLADSLNEDMLEDVMFGGVNKYVIENENQVEMVEIVAKEQGKSLLRL